MKETVASLRTYFLIVGVLGLVNGASLLTYGETVNAVTKTLGGLNILTGIIMIVVGAKLSALIGPKPGLIKAAIIARFAIAIVVMAIAAMNGDYSRSWLIALYAVIGYYLFKSVNKLSAQANAPQTLA